MVLQLALSPFALTQSHLKDEDESVVTLAIDAYRAGLDFADALHHASAHGCFPRDCGGRSQPPTRCPVFQFRLSTYG